MKQDNEPREASETLDSADISQILRLLPHRYPFLMIDRITDIDGDESGIGIKNVSINEPHFQGHFPGKPIMPGVLLMEGMAQTAGALCARAQTPSDKPRLVYFMSIDSVKFRRPVIPGDQVHFFLKKIHRRSSVWKFSGIAKVDGKTVAEAVLTAMMRDQPADE